MSSEEARKALRVVLDRGITERDVSNRLNVLQSTVKRWIIGEHTPSDKNVKKLLDLERNTRGEIPRYLASKGISADQIAEKIGVTTSTAQRWVNSVSNPNEANLQKLAQFESAIREEFIQTQKHRGESEREKNCESDNTPRGETNGFVREVQSWLKKCIKACEENLDEDHNGLRDALEQVNLCSVALRRAVLIGEFSAGKTHLVNGILGKGILQVSLDECTAIPTVIRQAEDEKLLRPTRNGEYTCATEEEKKAFFSLKAKDMDPLYQALWRDQEAVVFESPEFPLGAWEFVDLPGLSSTYIEVQKSNASQLQRANIVVVVVSVKQGIGESLKLFLQESIPPHAHVFGVCTYADKVPPKKVERSREAICARLKELFDERLLTVVTAENGSLVNTSWSSILDEYMQKKYCLLVRHQIEDAIFSSLDIISGAEQRESEKVTRSEKNASKKILDFKRKCDKLLSDCINDLSASIDMENRKKHSHGSNMDVREIRKIEHHVFDDLATTYHNVMGDKQDTTNDKAIYNDEITAIYAAYTGLLYGIMGTCRGICWRFQLGRGDDKIGSHLGPLRMIFQNKRFREYERDGGLSMNELRDVYTHMPVLDYAIRSIKQTRSGANSNEQNLLAELASIGHKLLRKI